MTCYLDDDLDQDLLIRLAASRSHRLISPRALGRSGDHDASHFLYAASQGLALLLGSQDSQWVHKTANVLNHLPKSVQPKAKADLHEIWQAETRERANKAFDHFLEKYQAKYQAACDCLKKDRDVLLSFYDFPAEHWGHLHTTNPIESTFATIRLRHRRTKGNGTRKASLTMMFKLAQAAQKRWRRLNKHELILPLIQGKVFTDGIVQDAA